MIDAAAAMAENNVGSLVVMEGAAFLGIVTERHLVNNMSVKGKNSPDTLVGDIMETRVLIARQEQSVEECMAPMTQKRVRHLPVLEKDELIGIISIGDLVKSVIWDQKFIIDQIEDYIQGRR